MANKEMQELEFPQELIETESLLPIKLRSIAKAQPVDFVDETEEPDGTIVKTIIDSGLKTTVAYSYHTNYDSPSINISGNERDQFKQQQIQHEEEQSKNEHRVMIHQKELERQSGLEVKMNLRLFQFYHWHMVLDSWIQYADRRLRDRLFDSDNKYGTLLLPSCPVFLLNYFFYKESTTKYNGHNRIFNFSTKCSRNDYVINTKEGFVNSTKFKFRRFGSKDGVKREFHMPHLHTDKWHTVLTFVEISGMGGKVMKIPRAIFYTSLTFVCNQYTNDVSVKYNFFINNVEVDDNLEIVKFI